MFTMSKEETQNDKSLRRRVNAKNKLGSSDSKQSAVESSWKFSLRKATAVFGCILVAAVLYFYTSSESGEFIFVGVTDHVQRAVIDVPCSKDYLQEPFNECKPKRCGRVVMDNLVSQEDAKYLLRKVKRQIQNAIADEFGIPQNKLYLTKPTFFSRMNMTEPKTVHDEYWHVHIDKVTYGSFHYTSLLYLTTYKEDFDGGRFVFVDKDTNRTVEPKMGRVSFFTSGSENPHFVERLRDGVRYAITVSFTCDPKKAIQDPESK